MELCAAHEGRPPESHRVGVALAALPVAFQFYADIILASYRYLQSNFVDL